MKKVFNHVVLTNEELSQIKRDINNLYRSAFEIDDPQSFVESMDAVLNLAAILNTMPYCGRSVFEKIKR